MKFFEKCRPEFYFHGGRLIKDSKSGKQYWRLNLVLTLKGEEVVSCDPVIQDNFLAIETLANEIEEISIGRVVPSQIVEFFSLEDHKAAALRLGPCDLTELRMTRVDRLTELWLRAEAENSDALHAFVKSHVFTRLWVEFQPAQPKLPGTMDSDASARSGLESLQRMADSSGITTTISRVGDNGEEEELVTFKPRGKKPRVN